MLINNIAPSIITILGSLIAISITFAIVSYFVYFPIKKSVEDRQEFISNNINSSIDKNKQADEFLSESEDKVKQALLDSEIILNNSKQEAEEIKKTFIEKTNQEIEDLKIHLQKNSEEQIKKQQDQFNDRVVELALEISRKILNEKVSPEEEKQLITKFMDEIENGNSK